MREEFAIVIEAEAGVFERQLNKLFEATQERLTNLAVVGAMVERGCPISAPYLSRLRTGVRTNPSPQAVDALADFFGVSSDYFYDMNAIRDSPAAERVGETTDADAAVVERLLDPRLGRLLALSLTLSPTSVELLIDFSGRFRLADLPDDAR
ncbi:helix-turn-helix domain-containing protein [Rhodococcus qingshengii]